MRLIRQHQKGSAYRAQTKTQASARGSRHNADDLYPVSVRPMPRGASSAGTVTFKRATVSEWKKYLRNYDPSRSLMVTVAKDRYGNDVYDPESAAKYRAPSVSAVVYLAPESFQPTPASNLKFTEIVAHELGHVLGMGHHTGSDLNNPESIMSTRLFGTLMHPQPYDVKILKQFYAAPTRSRQKDIFFEPVSNTAQDSFFNPSVSPFDLLKGASS